MTGLRDVATGYRPRDRQVRYVAAGLAYLVAALHIFHPRRGFPRLVTILTVEDPGREPIYHGLDPVEAVVAHLREYALVRVTKLAEATLFTVLAVLFFRER